MEGIIHFCKRNLCWILLAIVFAVVVAMCARNFTATSSRIPIGSIPPLHPDELAPGEMVDPDGNTVHTGDTLEHFNEHITPLLARIRDAKSVILFEGLPRNYSPSELLARGVMPSTSVDWHGFPFYDAVIVIDDIEKVTALCGDSTRYSRYTGEKFCGGFHPDWCIKFDDGENSCDLLLCFGCREVRLFGPADELFCDLTKESFNQFIDAFEPLHRELPARQRTK